MPDCETEIGPLISSPGAPVTPFIPPDLMSDESGSTLPISESEDSASISSASCFQTQFTIPSSWPPVIQACIDQDTDEARKSKLVPTVRSEICRVLANAMFCYNPNPKKELCTRVAKLLVKKYKFMADVGRGVTGYVSYLHMHTSTFLSASVYHNYVPACCVLCYVA